MQNIRITAHTAPTIRLKTDGEYTITAHVTIKGDMKMFTKKVTVGEKK